MSNVSSRQSRPQSVRPPPPFRYISFAVDGPGSYQSRPHNSAASSVSLTPDDSASNILRVAHSRSHRTPAQAAVAQLSQAAPTPAVAMKQPPAPTAMSRRSAPISRHTAPPVSSPRPTPTALSPPPASVARTAASAPQMASASTSKTGSPREPEFGYRYERPTPVVASQNGFPPFTAFPAFPSFPPFPGFPAFPRFPPFPAFPA